MHIIGPDELCYGILDVIHKLSPGNSRRTNNELPIGRSHQIIQPTGQQETLVSDNVVLDCYRMCRNVINDGYFHRTTHNTLQQCVHRTRNRHDSRILHYTVVVY